MGEPRTGRLGIFGGTFDPVHIGHLIIAEELRARLELDQVFFLPVGHPPHKTDRETSPPQDRLRMLELALSGNPHFAVSWVDVERAGPSFTEDSLDILQQQFPGQNLYFIMGEDSLHTLPNWRDPNRIVRLARLAVALRSGAKVDVEGIVRQVPDAVNRIDLVHLPVIQVASRTIRKRVRDGLPITYYVPRTVEEYIYRHGLYSNG